ncbi:MAG: alpha/beta hydrolase [Phycisphaerales bacterium]|nr:alpha/beta hydrolase [Phycisphaerales bacterium]
MDVTGSHSFLVLADPWQVVLHNWALFSILTTLLLLVIVPILILIKYIRICLNILRDTEPPLSMTQFGFVPLIGRDKDFYAADGIRLRGTLYRSSRSEEPRGMILFAPEFKSDRHSCARYCRPLLEAGYDIFSFDFRGHGESAYEENYTPRQWPSDRELADMMGAIAFAEAWLEEQGRPIELGLFGISRGACVSILASEGCASVRAIVSDGVFSSDCMLEHLMKRWAKIFAKVRVVYENHPPEFWRFLRWCLFITCRFKLKCWFPSVRKALTRMIPRPILFIHGERDSYIPVDHSRLLYALSNQPRYLWVVAGAKHNQSVDVRPEEYARRTVQFFNRYLARGEEADNMYNDGRFEEITRREQAAGHLPVVLAGPAQPNHARLADHGPNVVETGLGVSDADSN